MKLLFDQNLSHRLTVALADSFPGSMHLRDLGLARADDAAVWAFAKDGGHTIVSKDSDFHQRSFVEGYPPKIVWLQVGNCSTADIEARLRRNVDELTRFHLDETSAVFIIE
jgi:predicted nuclease of predicted toxin-antitoxin system